MSNLPRVAGVTHQPAPLYRWSCRFGSLSKARRRASCAGALLLISLLVAPATRGGEFTAAYLITDGTQSPLSLFLVVTAGEDTDLLHVADCAAVTPAVSSNIVLDDVNCDEQAISVTIAPHGLVVELGTGALEIALPAGPQVINGIPAHISAPVENQSDVAI